ncbi:hypothetical protein CGLAU_08195 [Corynebacterium glaucum]|uniref:YbjN domain-containing protein n=1 Tax=Corynebacterium glaucum TaxID=187491 RepID=A0A1Q2HXN6_9CORY|nr:YbjN domain-containing protein [Corynebacterium glaucum]AQQ15594.1 hypothetical protein CGLAU_08195 [Corynebacterium glaucum]
MGKHSKPAHAAGAREPVTEVTLQRVAAAIEGIGLEPLARPDRLVVGLPAYTAAVWIDYERPLTLVIDFTDRVPVAFDHGRALATFLNHWNHEELGAVASYRLTDSGDFSVRMRHGMLIRHGLSDSQLIASLIDGFEHAASFFTQLRAQFIPIEFDAPLPPTLLRSLDHTTLVGRHPSHMHLPAGERRDVYSAPDYFQGGEGTISEVSLLDLQRVLNGLDFAYTKADDVIATGANGVPFAITLETAGFSRVAAMWNSNQNAETAFLPLWLACNEVNQSSTQLSVYLHETEGIIQVHAETTCLVTEGMTDAQIDEFVISSLLSGLSAIDHITTQAEGASVVDWPPTS